MALTKVVQARVPVEIQDIADKVIRLSGLTISDVVRVVMTKIAQEKAIPQELFKPNAETLAVFDDIENKKNLENASTIDEFFQKLNA